MDPVAGAAAKPSESRRIALYVREDIGDGGCVRQMNVAAADGGKYSITTADGNLRQMSVLLPVPDSVGQTLPLLV